MPWGCSTTSVPSVADAQQDVVAPEPWLEIAQVVGEQSLNQLANAGALLALGSPSRRRPSASARR